MTEKGFPRKRFTYTAALTASLFFLFSAAAFSQSPEPSGATSEIETKKSELGGIENRIRLNESELKTIRAEMEKIKAEYEARKKEYEAAREEVGKNRKTGAELADERQRLARELKLSTDNLLRKKGLLRERIRIIYKNTYKKSAVGVLGSGNMTDLYFNVYCLAKMINWDSEFISDISKKVARIKIDREKLARKIKETGIIARSCEASEKTLRTSAARMDETLALLEKRSRMISSRTDDLAAERDRMAAQIASLAKARSEAEALEAAKKAEKETAEVAAAAKPAEEKPAVTLENLSFAWPLKKGKNVVTFFGVQKDPKYSVSYFNSGIDIAGAPGDEVSAAAAGQVRYKGEMKSVGKLLIIDHGGGITTLYSHLGAITVGMGQKVAPGEPIGVLGEKAGESRNSLLHFEIRLNGNARDPMDYL